MQSVYSSAAHAGIRGVSPPMPQSPTTKIAHIQSDGGRRRARQAGFAGSVPRSLRWSVQGGTGRSKGKASPVGPKISALVGPKRPSGRCKTASGRCKIASLVDARRPRVGKQASPGWSSGV
jgi:hypothetical protein